MNETSHPIPAAWLTAYYDGELDAVRRGQLEAHLPGCADCQRQLAALKSLSQTLSADELPGRALADDAAFWRRLEPQLPDRALAGQASARPAPAKVSGRSVLLRWAPGIGLLLLNGVVQVTAVVGSVVMVIASQLSPMPAWAFGLDRLAAASTVGWVACFLPADWSGLGMFALFMMFSAGLAVLYLAWLGYELRYGAPAARRSAA